MRLKLSREWVLGERIGGGGFGQVYIAKSSSDDSAVAKLVPKAPGAQRELLFVNLHGIRNIVPIIDSGETQDYWVLVMPRADKSLRQHLTELERPLSASEAIPIVTDITTALCDLDGKVVHRDLKPENILLLDGKWSLADFGISRYAEKTTAIDTRKFSLSPPYAAPERWRQERATTATDMYSLGVISYELLSNSRPFPGPEMHDFRDQHLHGAAPPVAGVPAALGALIAECLFKAPEARPTPANAATRLDGIGNAEATGGLALLQRANLAEVERRGESRRRLSQERSEEDRRKQIAVGAIEAWKSISETLRSALTRAAPAAALKLERDSSWSILLNRAEIGCSAAAITAQASWLPWKPPAFDVIAHAALGIRMPPNNSRYEGRSHSAWFCDAQEAGRYQWYETAFMHMPLTGKSARQNPFALSPGQEAAKALWVGLAEFQVAYPFTPLNVGILGEFTDRWANWFARAAEGNLQHPQYLPEGSPDGSWRTG